MNLPIKFEEKMKALLQEKDQCGGVSENFSV